jgi:hypothetical protein
MSRLPSFFRQQGQIKPPRPDHAVQNVTQARAHFKSVGSTVKKDGEAYILDHRGWSHGGVSAEGLIHIANEDLRLHRASTDASDVTTP